MIWKFIEFVKNGLGVGFETTYIKNRRDFLLAHTQNANKLQVTCQQKSDFDDELQNWCIQTHKMLFYHFF